MKRQDQSSGFVCALAEVALHAGKVILDCRDRGFAIMSKVDASPVTEADRQAEEAILAGLRRVAPEVPVISEEAASEGRIADPGHRFLLVDPLDGTREFVAGRDEFTVNIALVEGGQPVAGVVYAPALGCLAIADGDGASEARTDAGRSLTGLDWRPLATREVPGSGLVALASRSHRDTATDAFLTERAVAEIHSVGSSLKFLAIARGDADLYPRFGCTMEWDTAAGHAVLAAAGGCVVTSDGTDLRYGKRPSGYANPPFIAWGRAPHDAAF